jgi:short subunit dehydrogenase-like uncharacterized protein
MDLLQMKSVSRRDTEKTIQEMDALIAEEQQRLVALGVVPDTTGQTAVTRKSNITKWIIMAVVAVLVMLLVGLMIWYFNKTEHLGDLNQDEFNKLMFSQINNL